MPRVLRALAGEQEHDRLRRVGAPDARRPARRRALRRAAASAASSRCPQPRRRGGARTPRARPAACRPRRRARSSGVRLAGARPADPRRIAVERRRRCAPTARAAGAAARCASDAGRGRRLLQHDVRVGAADAERADAGAARRPSRAARAAARSSTKNGLARKSICGFGALKCRLGGQLAGARSASTVLISPATPAAASRWPMLVLTEPIAQKPRVARSPRRKARVSAAISIGSPSGVPVPCAST